MKKLLDWKMTVMAKQEVPVTVTAESHVSVYLSKDGPQCIYTRGNCRFLFLGSTQ